MIVTCEGSWPVTAADGTILFLFSCPLPAESHWKGTCECGHPRAAWLCGQHAGLAEEAGCEACLLGDGAHDCHVTLAVARQPGLS